MARATRKVAISMPETLYRAVERVRKHTRKTRSAVLQDALRHWLEHQAEAVRIQEYEAGYRRRPEGRREIKAAEAAAVRLFSTEDW
jgi:metal-responsive CopG/Arc/MetJ family transcriptional regulator